MLEKLFRLDGQVALVTGASSGIGKMIAQGFLEHGAEKVYITARGAERLRKTEEELSKYGNVKAINCDVTNSEDLDSLVQTIESDSEKLHILVNNAGFCHMFPFDKYPLSEFDDSCRIMLKAPFELIRKLKPLLISSSRTAYPSRIINISSIDAFFPTPYPNYAYASLKAALDHLTREFARDFCPHITVNSIAPGPILTEVWSGIEKIRDEFIEINPMKRLGNIEDMAGAAVYLASRAGSYVTGISLIVDGGVLGTLSTPAFDSVKKMFS